MNNFFHSKKGHKFERVSKRGRVAYLILCFENCLIFYKENIEDWKWVLEELWKITSTWDIDGWVSRVCDLSPESVLPYVSYEELMKKNKEIKEINLWYEFNEEEFVFLQSLYHKERMGFQVISNILDKIYNVIVDDWGDLEEPFTPSCLHNIDEAEEIMKSNNIPLPSNHSALKFIMEHEDRHYGKPFDGIQFSIISKINSN